MTWDDFSPYVLPYAPGCPDQTLEHQARLAAIEFFEATNAWQEELAALAGNGATIAFTLPLPAGAEAAKLLAVSITGAYGNVTEVTPSDAIDGAATMRRASSLDTIAFTDDLRTLTVWPAQPGASCTGSVTGSVLTATTMLTGAFAVGQKVTGAGLTPGFTIASFGTGTGANNGGTYNLSGSPGNVTGVAITAAGASIVATAALKPALTATSIPDAMFAHYAPAITAGALARILAMPKQEWTDAKAAGDQATIFQAKKASTARRVERGLARSARRPTTRWF